MKSLILFTLTLLTWKQALAYYEDHPVVRDLVESGRFEVSYNSCASEERFHKDALVRDNERVCLSIFPLPGNVEAEVGHMRSNELENESDYDQRITSLFHFSLDEIQRNEIELADISHILSFLNVEIDATELSLQSEIIDEYSFSEFDELFVDLFFKASSGTQDYIRKTFMGELVQIIKFEDGVELYPGGGFFTTHYLIISKKQSMYIKFSWWNS
ncbi:MAG: hypothetical protein CME63_02850 [Halobacteriovoraceae bacterium]|nr:hypothetical protein [Halobacteriovoraceae bacterium]|tara:strand:+ start:19900 stop:20544 length:645 start_codon:yes stop_codon:yes gene_type:complete